jgi:hypothetical protein
MTHPAPQAFGSQRAPVVLVSAHYYAGYQARNLQQARKLKAAMQIDRHVAVLNVDPTVQPPVQGADASRSTEWIAHDNTGHEFGAYQRGLEHVLHSSAPGWVIFMNDTIGSHAHLPWLSLRRLAAAIAAPATEMPTIVGFECHRDHAFLLQGRRSSRWMRTHCFALNASALRVLGYAVRAPELDRLVWGGATADSFFNPALDFTVQRQVGGWLFDVDCDSRWYRAGVLAPDNCDMFAAKARACIQEFHVSLRLDEVSAQFIDLCPPSTWGTVVMKLDQELFFRTHAHAVRAAK